MSDTNTPVPGSPEWDAQMVALADSTGSRIRVSDALSGDSAAIQGDAPAAPAEVPAETPAAPEHTQAAPQRPADVPEQFWNAEKGEVDVAALLKHVTGQQAAASKPAIAQPGQAPVAKPAAPATAPEATPPKEGEQPNETPPAPTVTLQDAMAKAAADFASGGALTDESYAALEAAGVTREYATAYVEGLQAKAEVVKMKVMTEAGGEDQYAAMAEWARVNWTAEQIAAHNSAVQSGDLNATLGAIRTMRAAYTATQGVDPQTRVAPQGGANNATPSEGYRTKEEFQKDISDPRYQKGDRAFHAIVDRKLEAAMRAGVDLGF